MTAQELVRAALGEPPIMTHADLARMLRHRHGGREVCPSPRQVFRWLHGQSEPRPGALRSLREVAALPESKRAAMLGRSKRKRR